MKIILSPAKQMVADRDSLPCEGLPVFVEKREIIKKWLKEKTPRELVKLWGCNRKIAEENIQRLENMNLREGLTPAVLSYDGIAFKYMAPSVFETQQFSYLQDHLRILSGFYGVLKPMDGVTPYRLEMQAKASVKGYRNLYEFWGDSLYKEVSDGSGLIINLASAEYYKCIEKYLTEDDRFITVDFCEPSGGKLVTKGTYAKMARGEMVRFMAENSIEDPEEIKKFWYLGYVFSEELSDNNNFVFIRTAGAPGYIHKKEK